MSLWQRSNSVDKAELLRRLKVLTLKDIDASEDDLSAFALDLDADGNDEIVFVASNFERLADHDPRDKPIPYFVIAGIQDANSAHPPAIFYSEEGQYFGGTDTIGDVTIKGIVSIAPETREIALLIKTSPALIGSQMLVRYRYKIAQRMDTIEFICN